MLFTVSRCFYSYRYNKASAMMLLNFSWSTFSCGSIMSIHHLSTIPMYLLGMTKLIQVLPLWKVVCKSKTFFNVRFTSSIKDWGLPEVNTFTNLLSQRQWSASKSLAMIKKKKRNKGWKIIQQFNDLLRSKANSANNFSKQIQPPVGGLY